MTQEKMTELVQSQDFRDAMQMTMIENLHNQQRIALEIFKHLNQFAKKGQTLFVGSSLMEWFPIAEMQVSLDINQVIYNRGIGGTTTVDLLAAMDDCIFNLIPSKIFINIGTNDIATLGQDGFKKETLIANYSKILEQIKSRLPRCEVYVMAYYPINAEADFGLDPFIKGFMFNTRTNANIVEANSAIEKLAVTYGFNFIDVNDGLADDAGNLKAEFSVDGIHMLPNGYRMVLENMKKYLNQNGPN